MNTSPSSKETHLNPGDLAPEFTLQDQRSRRHTLADYRGRLVLLYTYPEDDTSG
jgi:peroxiredoxin Q/BCP